LPWFRLCRPIITEPSLSDGEQTESLFDGHHNAFIDSIDPERTFAQLSLPLRQNAQSEYPLAPISVGNRRSTGTASNWDH
jgi:hypothetical protein